MIPGGVHLTDKDFLPRFQHDPDFCLAGFVGWNQAGIRIRWMHLNGERFPDVKELQQQREAAKTMVPCTEQLLGESLTQFPEGLPSEWSIGNPAHMVIAIAEHPGFTDGTGARQRRAQQVAQSPAAPEPILVDRFESHGIQVYLIHEISRNWFSLLRRLYHQIVRQLKVHN
jgi:hypothetical protein